MSRKRRRDRVRSSTPRRRTARSTTVLTGSGFGRKAFEVEQRHGARPPARRSARRRPASAAVRIRSTSSAATSRCRRRNTVPSGTTLLQWPFSRFADVGPAVRVPDHRRTDRLRLPPATTSRRTSRRSSSRRGPTARSRTERSATGTTPRSRKTTARSVTGGASQPITFFFRSDKQRHELSLHVPSQRCVQRHAGRSPTTRLRTRSEPQRCVAVRLQQLWPGPGSTAFPTRTSSVRAATRACSRRSSRRRSPPATSKARGPHRPIRKSAKRCSRTA